MDTDSLCLALSEENLEDVIFPKNELNGTSYVLKIALIISPRMQPAICSPQNLKFEIAGMPTKNMISESRVSSKKSLHVQKCWVSVAKHFFCYDKQTNWYKFSSKGLKKRTLKDCRDGPFKELQSAGGLSVNVTSTIRELQTIQQNVATHEQPKKGLSYFYPKTTVEEDEIHTKPLHL